MIGGWIRRWYRRIGASQLTGAVVLLVLPALAGAQDPAAGALMVPLLVNVEGPAAICFRAAPAQDGTYHFVWLTDRGRICYRSGALGDLSTPRFLKNPLETTTLGADPAIAVPAAGAPRLVWSAQSTNAPGEWNLAFAPSPTIDPWLIADDRGIGTLHPDRHPVLAIRGDSTLVVWERDAPSRIVYAAVTSSVLFPTIRSLGAAPAARPTVVVGKHGPFWAAWAADGTSGGEVWVAGIGGGKTYGPFLVRRGAGDDRSPSLAVDGRERLHIVWEDRATGAILYARMPAEMDGVNPPIVLTPHGTTAREPQIVVLPDGTPRIAWRNVATGALEIIWLDGDRPTLPVRMVAGTYAPRQAEARPGLMVLPSGDLLAAFIAPDLLTGRSGGWIGLCREGQAGIVLSALSATTSADGAVLLTWRADGRDGLRHFVVWRIADSRPILVRALAADDHAGPSGDEFAVADRPDEPGRYMYRVEAQDEQGAILRAVSTTADVLSPANLVVRATPNPFNGTTALLLDLPRAASVRAEVIDLRGGIVRTLTRNLTAGAHRITWDGRDAQGRAAASGVYHVRCRFLADDGSIAVRNLSIILLR